MKFDRSKESQYYETVEDVTVWAPLGSKRFSRCFRYIEGAS